MQACNLTVRVSSNNLAFMTIEREACVMSRIPLVGLCGELQDYAICLLRRIKDDLSDRFHLTKRVCSPLSSSSLVRFVHVRPYPFAFLTKISIAVDCDVFAACSTSLSPFADVILQGEACGLAHISSARCY
jgi:hypothetical protein